MAGILRFRKAQRCPLACFLSFYVTILRRRRGGQLIEQAGDDLTHFLHRSIEGDLIRLRRLRATRNFRTNCSDAACISDSVAGGAKLCSVSILRYITVPD